MNFPATDKNRQRSQETTGKRTRILENWIREKEKPDDLWLWRWHSRLLFLFPGPIGVMIERIYVTKLM